MNKPFLLFAKARDRYLFTFSAVIFYTLFVILFTPYDIKYWLPSVSPVKTMAIPFIGVVSGVLMFLSQYVQSRYFAGKSMRVYHLIAGFCFDVLFLALCISYLYLLSDGSFFDDFIETLRYIAPIIVLWYVIGLSILKVIKINQAAIGQQKILSDIQKAQDFSKNSIINLMDENNNFQLSLSANNLLFLESADNYVIVYYMDNEQIVKKMIRNSLKNMEKELSLFYCIRCHRSYIVNLNKVVKVKKSSSIYTLEIVDTPTLVPISRTYMKVVKEFLTDQHSCILVESEQL